METLRRLHTAIDRAVLDSYGWFEISTDCQFMPEYQTDDSEMSRSKNRLRYGWPDDVRDEVLSHLLARNAVQAEAERLLSGDEKRSRSSKHSVRASAAVNQLQFEER